MTRSTKRFLRPSRILVKNKAISKLMNLHDHGRKNNARLITIMHLLDTHIAHVARQIQEQVLKSRNEFFNTSGFVSKDSRRALLL